MKLTIEEVSNVASLARLALQDDEKERLAFHLNQIIEHFEMLQQLDTSGVPPTERAVPMTNVYREDVPSESLPREVVLSQGPSVSETGFIVPKVVDTE